MYLLYEHLTVLINGRNEAAYRALVGAKNYGEIRQNAGEGCPQFSRNPSPSLQNVPKLSHRMKMK